MTSMISIIDGSTALTLTIVVLFSLLVGSFLNVVIYRLPIMMKIQWRDELKEAGAEIEEELAQLPNTSEKPFNLSSPNSSCPSCQSPIRWYDNIPIISYALLLRAKCRHCKTHISIRYPLVELISAALVGLCAYIYGFNTITLALAVFTWALICLTLIDYDHQLLPDSITLPLLWLGLLINTGNTFTSLEEAVLGAAAGYLSLWSVFWIFKLITGKDGMGYGDFKLLAALGAWGGLSLIPVVILLSSVVGAFVGISLILLGKQDQNKPIPFGPYLAVAGWIALLFGDNIIGAYFQYLTA